MAVEAALCHIINANERDITAEQYGVQQTANEYVQRRRRCGFPLTASNIPREPSRLLIRAKGAFHIQSYFIWMVLLVKKRVY